MNVAELITKLEQAMSENPDVAGYSVSTIGYYEDGGEYYKDADHIEVQHFSCEVAVI
jgi:hypothetical protein